VHRLNSDYRLLLTGTPIQNKLKELWVLVDWVTKGRLLGSSGQFALKYVEHIVKGQDPKASQEQVVISQKVANSLMHTIRPILLQRKKCENIDLLKVIFIHTHAQKCIHIHTCAYHYFLFIICC